MFYLGVECLLLWFDQGAVTVNGISNAKWMITHGLTVSRRVNVNGESLISVALKSNCVEAFSLLWAD